MSEIRVKQVLTVAYLSEQYPDLVWTGVYMKDLIHQTLVRTRSDAMLEDVEMRERLVTDLVVFHSTIMDLPEEQRLHAALTLSLQLATWLNTLPLWPQTNRPRVTTNADWPSGSISGLSK